MLAWCWTSQCHPYFNEAMPRKAQSLWVRRLTRKPCWITMPPQPFDTARRYGFVGRVLIVGLKPAGDHNITEATSPESGDSGSDVDNTRGLCVVKSRFVPTPSSAHGTVIRAVTSPRNMQRSMPLRLVHEFSTQAPSSSVRIKSRLRCPPPCRRLELPGVST